jgi:undecaprenyl diphosphate synthase
MDGNGRWAQARDLPRTDGHRAGVDAARTVIEACAQARIEVLTLYSFSTENWNRPPDEVAALMGMITELLPIECKTLHENGIRFRSIGDREGLPQAVRRELEHTESKTADNKGMTLVIALNYGSRQEIVHAARQLAAQVQAGELEPEAIEEDRFSAELWTAGLPDPDLLIRTAGEFRLSNYLLWQLSYAELYIDDVNWPDFDAAALHRAIEAYAGRTRTRGGLKEP